MRTPKMERASALGKALAASAQEVVLLIVLCATAGVLAWQYENDTLDLLLWIIVLLVQSLPYLCTLLVATVSACPRLRAQLICGGHCKEQARSATY
jgi:ABC-type dipeptide/oligopeptide/nickel transport system permease component